MIDNKLRILLAVVLASSALLLSPTITLAAQIQSLNGLTAQNQTLQSTIGNISINSSGSTHTFSWSGFLPISMGGTGVGSFSNGSVLFSNGTTFAQDNSNLFWDNTNKRLGIGTTAPSGQLHLGGAGQAITNNYGLLIDDKSAGTNNYNIWSGPPSTSFDPYVQPIAGPDNRVVNVFTSLNNDLAGMFFSQGGDVDNAGVSGVAVTTGNGRAFAGEFENMAIGSSDKFVDLMSSLYVRSRNVGAGTVGEMDGIFVDVPPTESTGPVDNMIGIKIKGQSGGTNNYALYTQQDAGSNNYALYNSGDAKSYFGGNVGIKNSNPDASLDVVGSIKGDSTIILGNSTTPACIEAADSDGSGVTYITVNDGILSASVTKPSFCQ